MDIFGREYLPLRKTLAKGPVDSSAVCFRCPPDLIAQKELLSYEDQITWFFFPLVQNCDSYFEGARFRARNV